MIHRAITPVLRRLAASFPVVTLTGPRQSGKTTIAKAEFSRLPYAILEDPDTRRFAVEDPRGFLSQFPDGAILDEIQRVPDITSYLQGMVDDDPRPGRFIVSGSEQFELMTQVSQSLAGRTALLRLLPFTLAEARAIRPADTSADLPSQMSSSSSWHRRASSAHGSAAAAPLSARCSPCDGDSTSTAFAACCATGTCGCGGTSCCRGAHCCERPVPAAAAA
jgi:hypothetical protein